MQQLKIVAGVTGWFLLSSMLTIGYVHPSVMAAFLASALTGAITQILKE